MKSNIKKDIGLNYGSLEELLSKKDKVIESFKKHQLASGLEFKDTQVVSLDNGSFTLQILYTENSI